MANSTKIGLRVLNKIVVQFILLQSVTQGKYLRLVEEMSISIANNTKAKSTNIQNNVYS